jgi:hypothetical protein
MSRAMSVYLLAAAWEMPNTSARCSGSARAVLRDAEDADEGGVHDADGNSGESGGVVGEVSVHVGKVPG